MITILPNQTIDRTENYHRPLRRSLNSTVIKTYELWSANIYFMPLSLKDLMVLDTYTRTIIFFLPFFCTLSVSNDNFSGSFYRTVLLGFSHSRQQNVVVHTSRLQCMIVHTWLSTLPLV